MKHTIREMSWFKRRTPKPEPKCIAAEIITVLEIARGNRCVMAATYDDGNTYLLSGVVHHNDIKDTYTIQGLDAKGHSVVLDIEEF